MAKCFDSLGSIATLIFHQDSKMACLLISGAFEHSVLHIREIYGLYAHGHRLQRKTPHFPKHKFPVHATRNVQTQLKSTVKAYNTEETYFFLFPASRLSHTRRSPQLKR